MRKSTASNAGVSLSIGLVSLALSLFFLAFCAAAVWNQHWIGQDSVVRSLPFGVTFGIIAIRFWRKYKALRR
jgi:hypothetical protein